MFQPLEQFDPTILLLLFNKIYLSTINLSMYNIFFLATIILSFPFLSKGFFLFFWKNIIELIIQFFALELYGQQVIKKGQKYFIIIFSLFIFLLFSNLFGLFCYGFTITSHISVTFFFSSTFFLAIIFIGFSLHGLHFFNILIPSGAPKPLLPFLVCIEFLSYIARVFSLSIRLFANMMSGHTLLWIISSFTTYLFFFMPIDFYYHMLWNLAFIFPLSIIFILLFLEFAIAALQAYVFVILVCIYLNDSYVLDH